MQSVVEQFRNPETMKLSELQKSNLTDLNRSLEGSPFIITARGGAPQMMVMSYQMYLDLQEYFENSVRVAQGLMPCGPR